jgi:hypothetical protein
MRSLAPDVCPQNRAGNEASQAMLILGEDRRSRRATCVDAAPPFQLDTEAAEDLIARQIRALRSSQEQAAFEAQLSEGERAAGPAHLPQSIHRRRRVAPPASNAGPALKTASPP